MNSLVNEFSDTLLCDSHYYASNDSGLSSNSNGGTETDTKSFTNVDLHCDDLTKSLFINSIGRNGIIQADDIYSYKSKMEIKNINYKRFPTVNLSKSDNFRNKSSCTISNIFQDLANLQESECTRNSNNAMETSKVNGAEIIKNPFLIQNEDYNHNGKLEHKTKNVDQVKQKKHFKKSRSQNQSNNVQEYTSSSVKNYKGDKSITEIINYIQGSSSNKSSSSQPKSEKCHISSQKSTDSQNNSVKKLHLNIAMDSGVFSEHDSPLFKENHVIADPDSGTQSSHFVSLNNSDEDFVAERHEDFQEVRPKNKKKPQKTIIQTSNPSKLNSPKKSKSNLKTSHAPQRLNGKHNSSPKDLNSKPDIGIMLDSRDRLAGFLASQFSLFMKTSVLTS